MAKSNAYYNVRYEVLKKKFPDYLILVTTNKNKLGFKSFKIDKLILEDIKKSIKTNYRKKLLAYLSDINLPYIILDSLSDIKVIDGNNDKYIWYYNYISLCSILDEFEITG